MGPAQSPFVSDASISTATFARLTTTPIVCALLPKSASLQVCLTSGCHITLIITIESRMPTLKGWVKLPHSSGIKQGWVAYWMTLEVGFLVWGRGKRHTHIYTQPRLAHTDARTHIHNDTQFWE